MPRTVNTNGLPSAGKTVELHQLSSLKKRRTCLKPICAQARHHQMVGHSLGKDQVMILFGPATSLSEWENVIFFMFVFFSFKQTWLHTAGTANPANTAIAYHATESLKWANQIFFFYQMRDEGVRGHGSFKSEESWYRQNLVLFSLTYSADLKFILLPIGLILFMVTVAE